MPDDKIERFHLLLSNMYKQRKPTDEEMEFFRSRPEVSGMATDDRAVVLNPMSRLAPDAFESVARNERVRLLLDDRGLDPSVGLTKRQIETAKSWGSEYGGDASLLRKTIIARILSGDESLAPYTKEQRLFASKLIDHVMAMGK